MSRENLEIVVSVFEGFHRRDSAATFAAYHPQVEWSLENYSPWAETPVYHGHDGIRAFFRSWLQPFQEYEAEARDAVAAGDKVVITVYDCARGKGSGAPIERYHAQVWTFRDGQVVRVEVWDDRAGALAAAGLSERPAGASNRGRPAAPDRALD